MSRAQSHLISRESLQHASCSRSLARPAEGRSSLWLIWLRKYVILCLVCGGSAVFVGVLFIAIYFTLRSYTSSLQFFETIPTYVPAAVLIATGLMVMCFAKRRNRYTYLVKFAGGCCLTCVLLCVVVTVTTTVVHMNRLQTLHKCDYSSKEKACMCLSAIAESPAPDGRHQFVFNNTPNCEVVHGSLYGCLRALFGLSVVGILVCIFSSMLVYQLLSHERKKVYLEQLELRRRLLYRRHPNHAFCACYNDVCAPWPLWDVLDYRLLAPQSAGPERLTQEDPSRASHPSTVGRERAASGRRHPLSWLPWARNRRGRSSQRPSRNAVERLLVRDGWRCSTPSPMEVLGSPGSPSPWRNGCSHTTRSEARASHSRSARSAAAHRRTRSNDGVFHHLQMNPRFGPQGFPEAPCGYAEIPAYFWGPPPPYSQPPSLENVGCLPREGQETGQCSVADVAAVQGEASQCSSKMSTPSAQRHVVLTIGGDYPEVCSRRTARCGGKVARDGDSFIVEVPCFLHKGSLVFNTLPARSRRRRQPSPFKSLSNIPLCISRRLSLLRHENLRNSGGVAFRQGRKSTLERHDEDAVISGLGRTIRVICEKTVPSKQTSVEESSNNATETATPTVLTLPSDSSGLVPTTDPSWTPTARILTQAPVHAHSMPNLSVTALSAPVRLSSDDEDTWTSRDFADTCGDGSQLSDATSAPSIPDEEVYTFEEESESSQTTPVASPPPLPPKTLSSAERRQRYVVLAKRQVATISPLPVSRDPVTFVLEGGGCCACPSQPHSQLRPGLNFQPRRSRQDTVGDAFVVTIRNMNV
ncbi:unnamed protein product [Ixodes hexagonus]